MMANMNDRYVEYEISPQQRGIFIHIPRTGGTTISRHVHRVAPRMFIGHATAAFVKSQLVYNGSMFDGLFKFAFVRNPWERHVSWWLYCRDTLKRDTCSFESYIKDEIAMVVTCASIDWLTGGYWSQSIFVTDGKGNDIVDFIGQFEKFDEDFSYVCGVLGIDDNYVKRNESKTPYDYREYYDDESAQMIADRCKWEINRFGYTFDGGAA